MTILAVVLRPAVWATTTCAMTISVLGALKQAYVQSSGPHGCNGALPFHPAYLHSRTRYWTLRQIRYVALPWLIYSDVKAPSCIDYVRLSSADDTIGITSFACGATGGTIKALVSPTNGGASLENHRLILSCRSHFSAFAPWKAH